MGQVKSFMVGQKPMANGIALAASIALAGYCQYKCQKIDEKIDETPLGEGEKPMTKCGMNKYLLWGLVVLFMVPLVLAALEIGPAKALEPAGSFQARVSESADALRSRSEEGEFKKRVADAAAQLKAQIASSSATLPDDMSVADDTSSEVAVRAGEEIRRFLAENP